MWGKDNVSRNVFLNREGGTLWSEQPGKVDRTLSKYLILSTPDPRESVSNCGLGCPRSALILLLDLACSQNTCTTSGNTLPGKSQQGRIWDLANSLWLQTKTAVPNLWVDSSQESQAAPDPQGPWQQLPCTWTSPVREGATACMTQCHKVRDRFSHTHFHNFGVQEAKRGKTKGYGTWSEFVFFSKYTLKLDSHLPLFSIVLDRGE